MRALAVLLLLTGAAEAKPWQCVVWPKTCQEPVVIVPANPEPPLSQPGPIHEPPPVAIPVPTPEARPVTPPIAAPAPVHVPKAATKRIKSNFAKQHKQAKRKTAVTRDISAGECAKLRTAHLLFNVDISTVKARAKKDYGHSMTKKQIEQAQACLAGTS